MRLKITSKMSITVAVSKWASQLFLQKSFMKNGVSSPNTKNVSYLQMIQKWHKKWSGMGRYKYIYVHVVIVRDQS